MATRTADRASVGKQVTPDRDPRAETVVTEIVGRANPRVDVKFEAQEFTLL